MTLYLEASAVFIHLELLIKIKLLQSLLLLAEKKLKK